MNGPEIVVVGQIARDLVAVVDKIPPAGGSVNVRTRRELLGGKGGNIAVSLTQLGVRPALVGVVGDDATGDWLLASLRRDGVDISAVRRRADTVSALMVDLVTAGEFRYLESVPPGALLTPADVSAAAPLLGAASTVVVQLQQPTDATLTALRLAAGARRILDGVPRDDGHRDEILAQADVIRLDAQEAELLADREIADVDAARAVARDLLSRGPELVVLAVGSGGNVLVWDGGEVSLPLLETEQVDTTGGGDAFVAALAWSLARGDPYPRAGTLATAAAGLTVGHPGGRPRLSSAAVAEAAVRIRP